MVADIKKNYNKHFTLYLTNLFIIVILLGNTDFNEITKRLDEIIDLLKITSKPDSIARKIVDGIATGIGILGIISIIDILKTWLGG